MTTSHTPARTIEVRQPYVGEIPSALIEGFEWLKVDPEWQWVLVIDGKVMAQCLCAPIHGVLTIIRLKALPKLPPGSLLHFLRQIFRDADSRGMLGYVIFLSDQTAVERKLMRIVQRAGGTFIPVTGVWGFGPLKVGY
jgi:hypothetical protein